MKIIYIMPNLGKPVLKWLGGKSRLAATIVPHLGPAERLVEPFVGSGAIFMATNYDNYLLCDINQDIINIHKAIQISLDEFISQSEEQFQTQNNTLVQYLEFRDEFNSLQFNLRRAVLFLWLNKHCFNGLCRYNNSGKFNAHYGNYSRVICPLDDITRFHNKSKNAVFELADFRRCFQQVKQGDVVYCDPPYLPLSATASFVGYSKEKFNWQDQQDLVDLAIECRNKNIKVVISNSDTEFSRDLYKNATQIIELDAVRTISSKGSARGKAKEILAVY